MNVEGLKIRKQAGLVFQIATIAGILLVFADGTLTAKYSLATFILGVGIAALPGALAGLLWDEPIKYGAWIVGASVAGFFFWLNLSFVTFEWDPIFIYSMVCFAAIFLVGSLFVYTSAKALTKSSN